MLLALAVAFSIMSIFEYANSLLFPFPEGMDLYNLEAVRAFAASLPVFSYVMILLGWGVSSFFAGYVATIFSEESKFRLSLFVGIILTVLGILNYLLWGHPWWVNLLGLPSFLIFSYLGHKYAL